MSATDLEQAVKDLLAPLRELQITAHREEEQAQKILDQARARRREIDKMMRAVDPSAPNPWAEAAKKNGSKKKRSGALKYSPARIQEMTDWLQARAERLNAMNEGTGFYATEVVERFSDLPVASQSGLAAIFKQLHEAGIIRLAKTGGLGGRKYYKVVV